MLSNSKDFEGDMKAEKSVTVFTDHNDPALPKHVKALPGSMRRRWISSYNYYAMDNGDPEAAEAYADENTYMTLSEHNSMRGGKKALDELEPEVVKPMNKSLIGTVIDGIKALIGKADDGSVSPWIFYKSNDGLMRVFVVYSNVFEDKHKEIITEAAHKNYVEWVDRTGNYPDLHLWHGGPGTRWGRIDAVDYCDGFAVASGVVDKGKEHIAEAVQRNKDKVSHGFYGLQDTTKAYGIYVPFELSPLPKGAEANAWTAISISSKEYTMPFSDAKKAYFKKSGMTDEQITNAESQLKSMGEQLKAAGINYKSDDDPATEAGETNTNSPGDISILVGELSNIGKSVGDLAGLIAPIVKELGEVKTGMAVLKAQVDKPVDERVTEALTARVVAAGVGSGAVTTGTAVTKEAAAEMGAAASDDTAGSLDWMFGAEGLMKHQIGTLGVPSNGAHSG